MGRAEGRDAEHPVGGGVVGREEALLEQVVQVPDGAPAERVTKQVHRVVSAPVWVLASVRLPVPAVADARGVFGAIVDYR